MLVPVWIASTWVLHDTSTPYFWSSARTKAPRSGVDGWEHLEQLLDVSHGPCCSARRSS